MAEFHLEIDTSELTVALKKVQEAIEFWSLVVPLIEEYAECEEKD